MNFTVPTLIIICMSSVKGKLAACILTRKWHEHCKVKIIYIITCDHTFYDCTFTIYFT